MPRRYGQACPVAKSLEVLGERWTLLIVRDLLRGPARFQDLQTSLRRHRAQPPVRAAQADGGARADRRGGSTPSARRAPSTT